MARTRTQLRQLTVQQLGLPFISGTSDATGGSTTTLLDTPDLSQFRDDALIGSWAYISDGTPTFRDLRVIDSAQGAGSITFIPALGAAPDGRAYEILPFSATAIHQAIDTALTQLFDMGLLVREFVFRGIVIGSPIYNANFELWSATTTVDGWASTGAGVTQTRERDSANIGGSETSMGLASVAGTEGRLELAAPWLRFLWDMKGKNLRFYAWVRSATASHARIAIGNGSTFTYSSYHSGDGDWNLLVAEYSSLLSDTGLTPALAVANSATTSYFSDCWIVGGGEVYEYPWPIVVAPDGPSAVYRVPQSIDTANALGDLRQIGPRRSIIDWNFFADHTFAFPSATSIQRGILQLPSGLPAGERLLAHCTGPFTLPDSDTETVEVTLPESLMVAKMAAKVLLEQRLLQVPTSTRRLYEELISRLLADVVALSSGHGQSSNVVAFGPLLR